MLSSIPAGQISLCRFVSRPSARPAQKKRMHRSMVTFSALRPGHRGTNRKSRPHCKRPQAQPAHRKKHTSAALSATRPQSSFRADVLDCWVVRFSYAAGILQMLRTVSCRRNVLREFVFAFDVLVKERSLRKCGHEFCELLRREFRIGINNAFRRRFEPDEKRVCGWIMRHAFQLR